MRRIVLSAIVWYSRFQLSRHSPAETQSSAGRTSGWSVKAPLPRTNSEFDVAELDGKIYVMGGYPADRKTVAEVQVYDSKTDKWQIIAPLPTMCGGGAAVADGRNYVTGGRPPRGHDFAIYDPKADKWTTLANSPPRETISCLALRMPKFMSSAGVSRAISQ